MRLTIGAGSTLSTAPPLETPPEAPAPLCALAAAAANAPLIGNGFGMLDAANLPDPDVGLPLPLTVDPFPLPTPPPTDAIFANAATATASCENLH